jgi:hypothetical protein
MKLYPEIAALLVEIDAFIEREGMTPTAFGVDAVKDPNLYRRLKSNSNLTLATIDRVRGFMADHQEESTA